MIRDGINEKEIEKAIQYLINKFNQSGTNPKPVILHSLEVGLYLLKNSYDVNTIIAGLLHDLIEDTKISLREINRSFGKEVSRLISASTLNKKIDNPIVQYQESFDRAKKIGAKALLIRAADIYFNSYYYHLVRNQEKYIFLKNKLKNFINISEKTLKNEKILQLLKDRYKEL